MINAEKHCNITQKTWQGSKGKSPACAIFMKFGTLDLFLTRNWMQQVLSPKKPLESHIGDQRSMWSKIDNRRIAPRWKALDSGNPPTSK